MNMPEGMKLSIESRVAKITLARPDTLNSLTFEIYGRLRDLFAELEKDDRVRAVMLTGEGKGFCSGGDVHDIIGRLLSYSASEMTAFARMTCDVIKNMRRLRKPIVSAVNGTAAGAGAVLALASDLRVASDKAKIAFLFTKVGLTGADMGAAYLLPRVVGLSRATELLMFGEPVLAAEAHRIGLFNEVVPHDQLEARAFEVAKKLADGPSFALGMTKELLNNGFAMDVFTALDAEARAQTICMLTDDFKEFHRSFVEKRAPEWKGR